MELPICRQATLRLSTPEAERPEANAVPDLKRLASRVRRQAGSTISLWNTAICPDPCPMKTGIPSLDWVLGVRGMPQACIGELYGPEGVGKTTLALQLIARAQRLHRTAAFIDADFAFNAEYATTLGVHVNDLLFLRPDTAEQAVESANALAIFSPAAFIVIDSVPSLFHSLDKDINADSNRWARYADQFLPKLNATMARTGSTLLLTNQIRRINVLFGDPEKTPRGQGLKHYCAFRIKLHPIKPMGNDCHAMEHCAIGQRCSLQTYKNRYASPGRKIEFDLIYGHGICPTNDLLNLGKALGVVHVSGSKLYLGENLVGSRTECGKKVLDRYPILVTRIEQAASDDALAIRAMRKENLPLGLK